MRETGRQAERNHKRKKEGAREKKTMSESEREGEGVGNAHF